MHEFPILGRQGLDDQQRRLWDELTLGPRGFYTGGPDAERLPDLYNAWLQFPEFGQLLIRLGDELRARSELPGRARELVVLTTSAALGARVEFDFHVPFARNEGLSDAVIDALRNGEVPRFADETEQVIHEANVQFLRSGRLEEQTREALIGLIGFRGVIQLIAAISLYVITAYTTNVARVKLAEDFSADPGKLEDFFAGRPPQ
jgi:4-carboxymuconolactone decarboxylase